MMWLWAWFMGGGWILVAGGVVVLGLVAAAVVVGATARKRDYPGRHVLAGVAGEPAGLDFYGSMNLADEQRIMLPRLGGHLHLWGSGHSCDSPEPHDGPCVCECGIEQPYNGPGWREQTAANLSPEALAIDSGPGLPSLVPPGPVQAPTREVAQGRAVRVCADESRPAARADLTGSLTSRPHQEDPGSVAHAEPGPDPDWLDRQLAAHVAWVARMAPLVTGWSVAA